MVDCPACNGTGRKRPFERVAWTLRAIAADRGREDDFDAAEADALDAVIEGVANPVITDRSRRVWAAHLLRYRDTLRAIAAAWSREDDFATAERRALNAVIAGVAREVDLEVDPGDQDPYAPPEIYEDW